MKIYPQDRKLMLTVTGGLKWLIPYVDKINGKLRQDDVKAPLIKYKVRKQDILTLSKTIEL